MSRTMSQSRTLPKDSISEPKLQLMIDETSFTEPPRNPPQPAQCHRSSKVSLSQRGRGSSFAEQRASTAERKQEVFRHSTDSDRPAVDTGLSRDPDPYVRRRKASNASLNSFRTDKSLVFDRDPGERFMTPSQASHPKYFNGLDSPQSKVSTPDPEVMRNLGFAPPKKPSFIERMLGSSTDKTQTYTRATEPKTRSNEDGIRRKVRDLFTESGSFNSYPARRSSTDTPRRFPTIGAEDWKTQSLGRVFSRESTASSTKAPSFVQRSRKISGDIAQGVSDAVQNIGSNIKTLANAGMGGHRMNLHLRSSANRAAESRRFANRETLGLRRTNSTSQLDARHTVMVSVPVNPVAKEQALQRQQHTQKKKPSGMFSHFRSSQESKMKSLIQHPHLNDANALGAERVEESKVQYQLPVPRTSSSRSPDLGPDRPSSMLSACNGTLPQGPKKEETVPEMFDRLTSQTNTSVKGRVREDKPTDHKEVRKLRPRVENGRQMEMEKQASASSRTAPAVTTTVTKASTAPVAQELTMPKSDPSSALQKSPSIKAPARNAPPADYTHVTRDTESQYPDPEQTVPNTPSTCFAEIVGGQGDTLCNAWSQSYSPQERDYDEGYDYEEDSNPEQELMVVTVPTRPRLRRIASCSDVGATIEQLTDTVDQLIHDWSPAIPSVPSLNIKRSFGKTNDLELELEPGDTIVLRPSSFDDSYNQASSSRSSSRGAVENVSSTSGYVRGSVVLLAQTPSSDSISEASVYSSETNTPTACARPPARTVVPGRFQEPTARSSMPQKGMASPTSQQTRPSSGATRGVEERSPAPLASRVLTASTKRLAEGAKRSSDEDTPTRSNTTPPAAFSAHTLVREKYREVISGRRSAPSRRITASPEPIELLSNGGSSGSAPHPNSSRHRATSSVPNAQASSSLKSSRSSKSSWSSRQMAAAPEPIESLRNGGSSVSSSRPSSSNHRATSSVPNVQASSSPRSSTSQRPATPAKPTSTDSRRDSQSSRVSGSDQKMSSTDKRTRRHGMAIPVRESSPGEHVLGCPATGSDKSKGQSSRKNRDSTIEYYAPDGGNCRVKQVEAPTLVQPRELRKSMAANVEFWELRK